MGERPVLVVDGYNVLRSREGPYLEVAERDLDAARSRLVADVAAYAGPDTDAVVVFDGGANPHSDGLPREVAGVTVIFSRFGVEADSVIEQQVVERRKAGGRVTVVTSDAQTQWTVVGTDVVRMSAAGFNEEVAGDRAEQEGFTPAGPTRSTMDRRVDPEVSRQLARWARGES